MPTWAVLLGGIVSCAFAASIGNVRGRERTERLYHRFGRGITPLWDVLAIIGGYVIVRLVRIFSAWLDFLPAWITALVGTAVLAGAMGFLLGYFVLGRHSVPRSNEWYPVPISSTVVATLLGLIAGLYLTR